MRTEKIRYLTFLMLLALGLVQSKLNFGICEAKNQVMANFDVQSYVGKWYEAYRDEYTPFEKGASCVTAEYALINGNKISVTNKDTDAKGEHKTIVGDAKCKGAKCGVRFSVFQPRGAYHVLDTDYTNYAIVYSCS